MSEGGGERRVENSLDWESSPDLTAISKAELGSMLKELVDQEREISYQRRVLQGRIDIIRSELVDRGESSLSPEELARVLMDRSERETGV